MKPTKAIRTELFGSLQKSLKETKRRSISLPVGVGGSRQDLRSREISRIRFSPFPVRRGIRVTPPVHFRPGGFYTNQVGTVTVSLFCFGPTVFHHRLQHNGLASGSLCHWQNTCRF